MLYILILQRPLALLITSHDIILLKLKSLFSIESYLLRFIAENLNGRKQSVVVGVLHLKNYQSDQESPKVLY